MDDAFLSTLSPRSVQKIRRARQVRRFKERLMLDMDAAIKSTLLRLASWGGWHNRKRILTFGSISHAARLTEVMTSLIASGDVETKRHRRTRCTRYGTYYRVTAKGRERAKELRHSKKGTPPCHVASGQFSPSSLSSVC